MKNFFLCAAIVMLTCRCSSKYVVNASSDSETQGGLTLTVQWVKHKGQKLDLQFMIRNNYDFFVVIPENSLRVEIAGHDAAPKRSNDRTVLRPGEVTSAIGFWDNYSGERWPVRVTVQPYRGEETLVAQSQTSVESETFRIPFQPRKTAASSTKTLNAVKSATESTALPPVVVTVNK